MSRFKLAYDHNNMVPAPAGTATKQIIWETEDGIMDAWGTAVPTDTTAGYAPGCTFRHSDGTSATALYVNEGTELSCDFNPLNTTANVVTQIEAAEQSGTAAGAGPSPLIWDNSKWLEVMLDPTAGFAYFNDFTGEVDPVTAQGWTIAQVTSGAILPSATEQGGVVAFDSNGHASEADGIVAQLKNCLFKPAAGVTIRFEARVKLTDVTHTFYCGLAGVKTDIVTTTLDDTVDKCGFYRMKASTDNKLCTITARTNADDATADVADAADGTYVKIGFVINGLTSVTFYVNGVSVEVGSTAANIPNAVMCLTMAAKCVGAAADAELVVDWVRILQEGGRA